MAELPYELHLLPASATPLERALAGAGARLQELPVPIDLLKQPLQVPAAFLPFFAWEVSTDVWFRAWPEATKRAIAARSIELHRKKGTAYALQEYVRYAGGQVLDITTPPQRVFSGPSLTRAEREAWLAALPQVRTWRVRETATAGRAKAFHGAGGHALFVERSFAVPSTAWERLRRRARWVVGGIETTVKVADYGTWFQLSLPGAAGPRVFSGRPCEPRRFFVPSEAWRRIVTVAPQARLAWRSPVGPTLRAVLSEPERVTVSGVRGRSVFCDTPIGAAYFVASTAPLRIYERYPVVDGSGPRRGPAVQIMGAGHYGWPRHTAVVRTSAPGRRHPRAAGAGITALPHYWMPRDPEPLQQVRRAACAAQRLSERVLLDIGPRPLIVAGRAPVIAGGVPVIVGSPGAL
jgi:phage tail P2-like protein